VPFAPDPFDLAGGRSLGSIDPLGLEPNVQLGDTGPYYSGQSYLDGYVRFLNPWSSPDSLPKDELRPALQNAQIAFGGIGLSCGAGAVGLAGAGIAGISGIGSMSMTEIGVVGMGATTALEVATTGGVSEAGAGITIGLITSGGDLTAISDGMIDLATAGAASRFRPRSSPSSGKSLFPDLGSACPCPKNPTPDKLTFPGCGSGPTGNGPHRGGTHRDMIGPQYKGDGRDSHHMPDRNADTSVSALGGPAIQMDPLDHQATSSWGSGTDAVRYRLESADMIGGGRYRDAMTREIHDARRAAQESSGQIDKYNQAIREMLECAKSSGQLPKKR